MVLSVLEICYQDHLLLLSLVALMLPSFSHSYLISSSVSCVVHFTVKWNTKNPSFGDHVLDMPLSLQRFFSFLGKVLMFKKGINY